MANRDTRFLIKRSNVPGKIPTNGDLLLGELGLNTSDAILYTSGTTANTILPIGWDRVARTGDTMTGGLFTPFLSATTISATTYLNLPSLTGNYLPLSGGTVYGPTIYSSGLTANTLNVTGLTQTSGVTSTGGIILPHKTLTTNYTATTADYFLNITGDTLDVFLMTAVDVEGKLLVVKNEGSGIVNVISQFGELIDDRIDVLLTQGNSVQLVSDGVNWSILGYNISSTQANTGVISFTGLSKVTSSTFSVAPVKGFIVDDVTNPTIPFLTYVEYTGGTHTALYVSSSTETYVYLTSGGTVSQTVTPLTEQQRRQNIFLGKLGHADKTSIINAFSQPDFVLTPLSQLRDMFQPIGFVNGGVVPYANAANLTFATTAGYLYGLGINFSTDVLNPNQLYVSGNTATTFQYRTQTGGTASNVTNIDPLNYDLGGVITPLTGTKATNQRIYLVQNGVFRIQYGQTSYANFAAAVAGISTETFNTFSNFRDNAILIGILTVLSTASNLTDTSKAQFFLASKFGETVGTAGGISTTNLQQAYNNSTTPEITTNSILGALSIKNGAGTADNVTRIFEGQTGTNGVTSVIYADGYISGTTLHTSGFTANSTGISASTISATMIFTSGFTANTTGLSATTVSATTYLNLPIDIRVTGGTYSSGSATFTNNTGGTFTVTGFSTSTATAFTGGTVTGATNFTGGLTANTISATTYQNLPISVINTSSLFSTGLSATGLNVTGVTNSNFFGANAGRDATAANSSNFMGFYAGGSATNANNSNFFGNNSGYQATNANNSNFMGYLAGSSATNASNSNLFGYQAGKTFTGNNIGGNNIIIGTNISLPNARANGINIGGVLFGINTYSSTAGEPSTGATSTGKIGINVVTPTEALHVSGNTILDGSLNVTGNTSSELVKIIQNGSGDAFVVEDQANGDASHFVINASGNTAIGLTQPLSGDKLTVSGKTSISGNLSVSGNTTISGSGSSVLTVIGSGTTTPIFSIQGSSGELFSVTDSLTGSLFSVNDISGLPIVEVFSDNTILMGNYLAPSLNTTTKISLTAGTNTIYSIPTSAYTGAFVDYTVINSGNTSARAGNIMTIWNSGSTQYTEVSTNDIGSTTGISFSTSLSGSNALISASATTAGWTLKTIIRAI